MVARRLPKAQPSFLSSCSPMCFHNSQTNSRAKKHHVIPVLLKKKHSERISKKSDQWSVINKCISNISKPCGVDFCLECNQICGLCEGTGCNQVGPGPNCQHHPPFLLTGCGGEGKRRHPNKQQNNRNENMPKKVCQSTSSTLQKWGTKQQV